MHIPTNIKADREQGFLELSWPSEEVDQLPFRLLRGRCPCAACVNEFTGERMVDIEDIPEGIQPLEIELTGNYALKIQWNDRHETGFFTWEYLTELCQSYRAALAESPSAENATPENATPENATEESTGSA